MCKTQCKSFYQSWLSEQEELVPEEQQAVFSNKWIRNWMEEYNVSLQKLSKWYQTAQKDEEKALMNTLNIDKYLDCTKDISQ